MRGADAHRVWLGYCAVEAFAFGLGEKHAKKHGKLKRSG